MQGLSRIIGVPATIRVGSVLGTLSSYLFKREKQISIAQLNIPEAQRLILKDREQIVRENFSHVGESIAELLCIKSIFDLKDINNHSPINRELEGFSCQGFHNIFALLEKGGMVISGHIGSIELLAAYHVQRGIPLHVIARSSNYSSAQRSLEKLRKSYGITTIWRENPSSMRELTSALKSGAVIAALIDQDVALASTYSNFLGLPAAYPIAPIKIAIRYNIPIVSTFIYRLRHRKHHIYTKKIDYNPEDKDCEQKILDEYGRRLGKVVIAYPEQWLWWHRRWRRQPNTEQIPSTKKYIEWLNQIK